MYMYMFTLALICFLSETKHLLITMVCLEFMALVVFATLSSIYMYMNLETIYSLLYIPIAACEAALGFMLIILYSSKKGNELLKVL